MQKALLWDSDMHSWAHTGQMNQGHWIRIRVPTNSWGISIQCLLVYTRNRKWKFFQIGLCLVRRFMLILVIILKSSFIFIRYKLYLKIGDILKWHNFEFRRNALDVSHLCTIQEFLNSTKNLWNMLDILLSWIKPYS